MTGRSSLAAFDLRSETSRMDLTEQEIDLLRRMTVERKLTVMNALIRQAHELKVAALRARWPDLEDAELTARAWVLVGGDRP